MKQIFSVTFIISLIFSVLGSIMAFLITYEEYSHHYADKKKPFQHAMQAAIFTFVVLLFLVILSVSFLMRRL